MTRSRILSTAVAATAAALIILPTTAPAMAAGTGSSDKRSKQPRDSDRDGMPDRWERANGLNPRHNDAAGDKDHDKLRNLAEFRAGTNPRKTDTDRDSLPDAWEVSNHLDATHNDAGADPDRDGLTNREEYQIGDKPDHADSDRDGTPDGAEDRDHDGLSDHDEFKFGDDPRESDSDHDGTNDGQEKKGTVDTFAPDTGLLTFTTAMGVTVTVTVTDSTEFEWKRESRLCASPAGIADLTPGRFIAKVETQHGEDRDDNEDATASAIAEKIKLICS